METVPLIINNQLRLNFLANQFEVQVLYRDEYVTGHFVVTLSNSVTKKPLNRSDPTPRHV